MMLIARTPEGWCIIDAETRELIAGPYTTHDEAVQSADTIAYRHSRGWPA